MKPQRIKELRAELEAERIDLTELAEIEEAFAKLPDDFLRDERENAMASDMLDELERWNENAIHRATEKFDKLTEDIHGSHEMLIGAMHKLIYDELNNGSGNWANSTSRLARSIVAYYLGDQVPAWLTKTIDDGELLDRKPRHVTDASWIKLINTVLKWLRVDEKVMRYDLSEDHDKLKQSIKKWEIALDDIVKRYSEANKGNEFEHLVGKITDEIDAISNEMMAVNM